MSYPQKIFILLSVFLSTLNLSAQDNYNDESALSLKESYLTFDVFSSLDGLVPRWRLGYIKSINPKWKIGLNIGYGNKNISYLTHHIGQSFSLWEIRPELYKVFKKKKGREKYLSVELFYLNHNDVFYNGSYYLKKESEVFYNGIYYPARTFDQANYQRHKYGFNFKIGKFTKMGKHFGLNIFTGFGLRMRDVSFSNVLNPRPSEFLYGDMFGMSSYQDYEGMVFGLNYSFGLKLLF